MLALKHKIFELEPKYGFYWGVGAALRAFDGVRRRAEEFAAEVGAENVVSIVEHAMPRFAVVLWYREEQEAKPAPADEFFESPSYR